MLKGTRRFLFTGAASNVGGGKVNQLRSALGAHQPAIQPSISSADVTRTALELKLASALAREFKKEDSFVPPLARRWVRAPISRLSTSVSRRDWFRVMSFNLMTDAWAGAHKTTPVSGVRVRIPAFSRTGEEEVNGGDGFLDYDPTKDTAVPPFLTPSFKRHYLTDHLRHYDPDLVCLNEVNRTFFNTELFKYIRYLGYGTLYQSSRAARVKALRKGENASLERHKGKIPESEDIGNVILFHKSRFVPLMMGGAEYGKHFHFVHLVSMRDKVTNLNVFLACVQFTAGNTQRAREIRLHEASQTLRLLQAIIKNDGDRSHSTVLICGDLNVESDDEPCVEELRRHYFSTYDLVGGPRWTAWHYRDEAAAARYQPYFQKNVEEMERSRPDLMAQKEMKKHMRLDTQNHGKFSKVRLLAEDVHHEAQTSPFPWILKPNRSVDSGDDPSLTRACEQRRDHLALLKSDLEEKGITYQTKDFIFYDPKSLALHQVLDVPDDEHIEKEQLFPNNKLPSHHLPLFVDVSFNDQFPDVGHHSQHP
ncbi:hypothetical protein STCU_03790 [Strigomonas culicis]|uniref:Endonuclease/exonuclease/phosphatase domain-containing protein n=1 Tax=Strigomonas culicis TaxID=28005 RepID=S9UPU8_9TRYP|nr:hypothetical protein STCU_03790 [Strigomonas culicis]|eukprot:EPY30913.1 hypothetical protein STCU_03790 [Strigomonas culicis]